MAGVIGSIAVHHEEDVRIDVGEHPAHHAALPRLTLLPNLRPRRAGGVDRVVGGPVVKNVNRGVGKSALEVAHDVSDGRPLIKAGDEDRDASRGGAC